MGVEQGRTDGRKLEQENRHKMAVTEEKEGKNKNTGIKGVCSLTPGTPLDSENEPFSIVYLGGLIQYLSTS